MSDPPAAKKVDGAGYQHEPGYHELVEAFERLYPEYDPQQIISLVMKTLDEQRQLLRQAFN